MILFLIGCSKSEVSKETFTEVAKFNGYNVYQDMTGYDNYPNIIDVYYAENKDKVYKIQFLELNDLEYAKKFFNLNYQELLKFQTSDSYVKKNNTLYAKCKLYSPTNKRIIKIISTNDISQICPLALIKYYESKIIFNN
jgi:hypothetical protein